ncbi:POP1 family protein [Megaselia abdita]
MTKNLSYDADDGGETKIKQSYVQTFQYAAANIKEMDELVNEIKNPTSTKLIFQSLPKHMRRRAMSHNPKRLPRKYRVKHKSQMAKAGNPTTTKRPSRKFRRKPSNLMKEYTRRQRKNVWLETHIWHAKRFHMISKWGYKLPFASCDKTYRACYRASAKHCLLQDISFLNCIEIIGSLENIKTGFEKLTSSKCGLGITAKTFISGRREGFVTLFKKDQYPYQCLGKVSFLWKSGINESERVLWVFVHPSFYRNVLKELFDVFDLKKIETFSENELLFNRINEYQGNGVCLRELKDTLNRFRLTGPLSQAILSKVMIPFLKEDEKNKNWFQDYSKNNSFKVQNSFWEEVKDCNSPAELLSNMILGLVVEDFRLQRPKKRTKAVPIDAKNPSFEALTNPSLELPETPLWNHELRKKISENFISNHILNEQRNKTLLVPGEQCLFEKNLQPIPVLLIQRPGSQNNQLKRLGYSAGWDVLVPSGYGLSLWLSLVMWGCRPGGIRETHMVNKEFGSATFLPDTISGKQEISETGEALKQRYFQLPPNKRCNYSKFAISSPFKPSLSKLVNEWSGSDNFYILRDIQLLRQLESNAFPREIIEYHKNSLIQVCLQMKTRGNPKDLAIICIPTKNDLRKHFKTMSSNDPVYTEPLKIDPFEEERKILKSSHKKLLKRLRNRRVRQKRMQQKTSCERVKIAPPKTSAIIKEQFDKMCDLWVPRSPSSIRNQCSREVFGYVTQSSFCLSEGRVTAVGYVTPQGLNKIMKDKRNPEMLLLVRGTNTRHYRFAKFKVNIDV